MQIHLRSFREHHRHQVRIALVFIFLIFFVRTRWLQSLQAVGIIKFMEIGIRLQTALIIIPLIVVVIYAFCRCIRLEIVDVFHIPLTGWSLNGRYNVSRCASSCFLIYSHLLIFSGWIYCKHARRTTLMKVDDYIVMFKLLFHLQFAALIYLSYLQHVLFFLLYGLNGVPLKVRHWFPL